MRCTNCDAHIPYDAGACPECGVFARVLDRAPQRSLRLVLSLLLIGVAVIGAAYFFTRPSRRHVAPVRLPVRVVHDRPGGARVGDGATINEAEAILRLQRSFDGAPDCVAIMSKGYRDGGYILEAINHCDRTRSGRWRVDGRSGAIRHTNRDDALPVPKR